MSLPSARPIPVGDLYLDPLNPRLAGFGLRVEDQAAILGVLWREMSVNELVDSIASTGYWPHEEIFAAPQGDRLVAIEGNRRLAAVKLLTDRSLRDEVGATGIPVISAANKAKLARLPVVICSREQIWEYVGFKHVNGPQEWDSIAKAEYIARVHNEYDVPLEDIAKTIGDRHDTVKRLYRGLMVLQQAEKHGVFNREDRWSKRFAYSHLWTGLGYAGVQEFLGLGPDRGFRPNPISRGHLKDLGNLLLWIYGSKEKNQKPLVQTQNPDLRYLDEAIRTPNGQAALRAGLPLEVALKTSRGDERMLREAMVKAEVALKEALGLIPTGFKKQTDLFDSAGRIKAISEGIFDRMKEAANRHSAPGGPRGRRG